MSIDTSRINCAEQIHTPTCSPTSAVFTQPACRRNASDIQFSQPVSSHAVAQHNGLRNTVALNSTSPNILAHAQLPNKQIIDSQSPDELLILPLQIHSINISALVDCGATHNFISQAQLAALEHKCKRTLWHWVTQPLQIMLADKTTIISGKQATLPVSFDGQIQQVTFAVLDCLNHPVVLGMQWLSDNNPNINWQTRQITLATGAQVQPLKQPNCALFCSAEAFIQSAKAPGAKLFAVKICAVDSDKPDHLVKTSAQIQGAKQLGMQNTQLHTLTATSSNMSADSSPTPDRWQTICDEYSDVFEVPTGLPPHREIEHKIDLFDPTAPIPNHRQYRMSQSELQEVQRQVEELLKNGWIQPSTSQYNHPILFVQKKDGTQRMCIDYRALNANTIIDRFPIPRIDDILDQLGNSTIFSKIDLAQGYHQVRITPGYEHRTAFQTRFGLFEYRVLPFGLNNAPATFQRLMNSILHENLNKFCTVYLDDILIFSRNAQEHEHHLRWVLSQLRKNGLKAKRKKCAFGLTELEYLGHIVSKDGLKADPKKCTAISERTPPKSIPELQTFLGMATYYAKFVPHFAEMATPLYQLLHKNIPWEWNSVRETAFRSLQCALTTPPILCLPNFHVPFTVETDASDNAIGAVLTQRQSDGSMRPIAYYSKTLNSAQQNYATYDKEMYAIYAACKHWRPYLQGQETTVITDHSPLQHFFQQKDLNKRQARWQRDLADTPIQIVYRPGVQAVVPDYLSRPPKPSSRGEPAMLAQPKPQMAFENDVPLNGKHSHSSGLGATAAHTMPQQDCVELNTVLVEPQFLVRLSKAQMDASDAEMNKYVAYAKSMNPHFHIITKYGVQLLVRDNTEGIQQLVIPKTSGFRQLLLEEMHETPFGGHLGVRKLIHALYQRVWWPKLGETVRQFVAQCSSCARTKDSTRLQPGLLQPLPIPNKRFESWSIDFTTDLPDQQGFNTILTCIDRLTKFVVLIPCAMGNEALSARETATLFFTHVVSRFGVPREILSDRDPRFTATLWKHLWLLLGTKTLYSTSYHPQTDGQTERTHRTIQQVLRALLLDGDVQNWVSQLPYVALALNSTINVSTKKTPFELVYGENISFPLDLAIDTSRLDPMASTFVTHIQQLVNHARSTMQLAQQKQKVQYDRHHRDLTFSPGDLVYLSTKNLSMPTTTKRKLGPRWLGPFPITCCVGTNAYRLGSLPQWLAATNPTFNISALKPATPVSQSSGQFGPVLPDVGNDDIYEVERIISERKRSPRFLVRWRGYSAEHDSWVDDLNQAPDVLAAWQRQKQSIRPQTRAYPRIRRHQISTT